MLLIIPSSGLSRNAQPPQQSDAFVCGTTPERQRDALARAQYHESRLRRLAESSSRRLLFEPRIQAVQQDIGDVAVLEDDGTLVTEPNAFDLIAKAIRFEPISSSSYRVVATGTAFDGTGGTSIKLADDDTFTLALQSPFSFYGQSYNSVQINSDGNLTFLQGDDASTDRDLGRFSSGPPRIGPFFTDLDPSKGGTISYRNDADGILIAWSAVPPWSDGNPTQFNSFSAKLFGNGNIEFVYGTRVDMRDAVIGISPGSSLGGISAVDFTANLPTQALTGTIAEVFATALLVNEASIAKKYFQNHPDDFDHLNLFLGFNYNLGGGAYAYELPVKNEISGIGDIIPGQPIFDYGSSYGSNGRLRSFLNMGTLTGTPINNRYPDDPNQVFFNGTNSTLGIMGQESGHRWEAFTAFSDGGLKSTDILGRDLAHWSFFFNSEGSVMEGNQILDRGADKGSARFLTGRATFTYSKLDQYIMGLILPESVSPMFLVVNPFGTFNSAGSPPAIDVAFGGDRKDLTIDSIIAANGPRVPSSYQAPKVFRQGFIYLVRRGQTADPVQINKVQRIRDAWVKFFNDQTEGRGWIVSDLQDSPATTPSPILFPSFQGNNNRYTGIAVANWGAAPADVLFTAYDNSGNAIATPGNIINPRMMTIAPRAQIAVVAEQMHGLSLSDPHNGWIRAQSTSSQVTGFFLDGNSAQTILTGAVAGRQTDTALTFMRAQISSTSSPDNSYRNLINVINPDSSIPAQLTFALFDESGNQNGTATRSVPPQGRIAEDLASLIPGATPPRDKGYVTMKSSVGVVAFQSIDTGATIFALPAVPTSGGTQLYSAQFVSGPAGDIRYFSELNLINAGTQPRNVQVLLVGNDGTPVAGITNPVSLPLFPPGKQYRARGEDLFGLSNASAASTLVEGSLVITADGPGMIGDVTFGDPDRGRFIASLPLDANPLSNLVLSQVAEGSAGGGKPYFTGIAMYNPGINDVNVTVDVYSSQGSRTGTASFPLARGNRISKTLPQIVTSIQAQLGGYIRVSVSGGSVISYGLFGTQSLDFLAAIPAQAIYP